MIDKIVQAIIGEFPELCWEEAERRRAKRAIGQVLTPDVCATCRIPSTNSEVSQCPRCQSEREALDLRRAIHEAAGG